MVLAFLWGVLLCGQRSRQEQKMCLISPVHCERVNKAAAVRVVGRTQLGGGGGSTRRHTPCLFLPFPYPPTPFPFAALFPSTLRNTFFRAATPLFSLLLVRTRPPRITCSPPTLFHPLPQSYAELEASAQQSAEEARETAAALREEVEAAREEAEAIKQELRVEKNARAEQVGPDNFDVRGRGIAGGGEVMWKVLVQHGLGSEVLFDEAPGVRFAAGCLPFDD